MDTDGSTLLEVRSTGAQTIFPPSVHPSGEEVVFCDRVPIADIEAQELIYRAKMLASATLLARHWPGQGSRNNAAMALFGGLLRSGMTTEQVERFIKAITTAAGDDEVDNRLECVSRTADKLDKAEAVTGWPKLSKIVGEDVVKKVRDWLGVADAMDATDANFPYENKGSSQPQDLTDLASEIELFHSLEDEAYALIPVNGHHETWELRSKSFQRWLRHRFYVKFEKAPNKQALEDALGVLEGKALFDGATIPVHTRLAEYEGDIYLDLGNEPWEVVRITAHGWEIIDNPSVRFRRTSATKALPRPVRGGTLDTLRGFINAPNGEIWIMIVSWLLGALRPHGPYPILMLQGEQGSAKSTTARILRDLIDPAKAPLRTLPRKEHNLMISATSSWVLSFDNLSGIRQEMSDALCRLATGGGFSIRSLYTNRDEEIFEAMRPMILNGIDDIARRDDLAQRSLIVNLNAIEKDSRKTEEELWAAFEQAKPRILGALLDAVSAGLRNLPRVNLDELPRMADFAKWVVACEPALPWQEGLFMDVYNDNRDQSIQVGLEADVVANTVIRFMENRDVWTDTATELHRKLELHVPEHVRKTDAWPKNGRWLVDRLKRAAPKLRAGAGLDITYERENTPERRRVVRIEKE